MSSNCDKIKAAIDTVSKGLASIDSDESWLKYLAFAARFADYSYNNILLIMMQRPDATYCMGYRGWQKIDRYVKRGEKGIAILCPCIRKVEEFVEPEDAEVYNDKQGEKHVKKILGFRVGYIYDLAQTDGSDEHVPVLVKGLAGNSDDEKAVYESLLTFVRQQFSVVEVTGIAAKGSYNLETHEIQVRSDLEYKQKIKSLLHELSHAYDFEMHPDEQIPRNKRELIAESCAYVVCLRLGIDTSQYSFSYLKSWLKDPDEIKETADSVQKVSARIINGLAASMDAAFSFLQEEETDEQ